MTLPRQRNIRSFPREAVDGYPDSGPKPELCFHCGLVCPSVCPRDSDRSFCCAGCQAVFSLLQSQGLGDFYSLSRQAGVRPEAQTAPGRFAFLDNPKVQEACAEFTNGRRLRITWRIPSMHCLACVWLLENLFRIEPGFGPTRVQFACRLLSLDLNLQELPLSRAAERLAELGYPPELRLSDAGDAAGRTAARSLDHNEWLRLGLAGFAFGNTMLFSLATYLGLDALSAPGLRPFVGWVSLGLALPVIFYSAANYWKASWLSLRQRRLNIEVPIAAGILALFGQSTWEVVHGRGPGYFDSLCALIFFLLIGRWFSRMAWDRLSFDRDYRAFFPLSTTRRTPTGDQSVAVAQLEIGDSILVRAGELIPADARLLSPSAEIDYSFVTGESEPVGQKQGELVYAGGRQTAGIIEARIVKPVSQSYLTSLWDQSAYRKNSGERLDTILNRYSPRFTGCIVVLAISAWLFWFPRDPSRALQAFVSILIVACPCALVLAPPFALGTAQRLLAGLGIFLRNPQVLEDLARINTVILDKTGTLTVANGGAVELVGAPLDEVEKQELAAMLSPSPHPVAVRLRTWFNCASGDTDLTDFKEVTGGGVQGRVGGRLYQVGSQAWFESLAIKIPTFPVPAAAHIAVDGSYRASVRWGGETRDGVERIVRELRTFGLVRLLSGDRDREGSRWRDVFGSEADLQFHQSPVDKRCCVQQLEKAGSRVMMVGDGLNDSGALRESSVGVAVVESVGVFSPASDIILDARSLIYLPALLRYSRSTERVVRICLGISTVYNLVGLSIAARGELQPVVCAILMPLSSVTVVAAGCGLAAWAFRNFKSAETNGGTRP